MKEYENKQFYPKQKHEYKHLNYLYVMLLSQGRSPISLESLFGEKFEPDCQRDL